MIAVNHIRYNVKVKARVIDPLRNKLGIALYVHLCSALPLTECAVVKAKGLTHIRDYGQAIWRGKRHHCVTTAQ